MRIVAGSLKGRQLELPKGSQARPTGDRAREAIFNILMPRIYGASVLDMFAGSGALGVEAISRGAQSCIFVELDRANAKALRQSLERFGVSSQQGQVIGGDFRQVAPQLIHEGKSFDLIFLDPPYAAGFYEEAFAFSEKLLKPGGMVIAEHERGWEIPEPKGLVLEDRRQYGKNTMSFYSLREDVP